MLKRVCTAVLVAGAAIQIASMTAIAQEKKVEKKVKDTGEYEIYNSASKETDPAKQLPLLMTWKEKYPDSDFKQDRADAVAQAYFKLNKYPEAVKSAQDAMAISPKDLPALMVLSGVATSVLRNANPGPDVLAVGDQASGLLVTNLGSLFDPSIKPPSVKDADWTKAKGDTEQLAMTVQGYVKWKQKDNAAAEQAFRKVLQANGENAQVSLWLGQALYSQKKFSEGLFEYARAASYTGTGALAEPARASLAGSLKKAYEGYHGADDKGLKELTQQASAAALPPDGFYIKSVIDIQKEEEGDKAKFAAAHPDIAFWQTLKEALKGDNGQSYFEQGVKDSTIPPEGKEFKQFKGHVVSQPSPKELLVTVDEAAGDATLVFDTPLKAKIEPGQEVAFAGSPDAFTKDPFNLRMKVEKGSVTGLPKEPAAPVRHSTGTKKTVAKK